MLDIKQRSIAVLAAAFCLFAAATALFGHHTFAVEYDTTKVITLKGEVVKVEWKNPHAYLYIEAKDAKGKIINWALEGSPPGTNMLAGWKKDMLKKGDMITVTAHPARDSSNRAAAREVTFPDGETLLFGAPDKERSTRNR
jgi:hypothetical protein